VRFATCLGFALVAALTAVATAAVADSHAVPATTRGAGLVSATPADFGRVSLLADMLARELSVACPFAPAGDHSALEKCRAALYRDGSFMRRSLPDYVLWGRINDPKLALSDTTLTQFGRDVFTAAYAPLFMFDGEHEVLFDEREKLYRIEFVTAFRNRLLPGEFPYPFWHDEKKWSTYQGANRMTVWVGFDDKVGTERIKAMQFSTLGKNHAGMPTPIPLPVFDKETHGKWMWTDADGRTQPQVTLFDGLYRADNPQLKKLDATYRAIAIELRNDECISCHVPSNPDKMKRLVLLQTPAHAASEIGRVIKAIREDRMPLDEIGIEKPMPKANKEALLIKAEAFAATIEQAKAWEASQRNALPDRRTSRAY
jgi:hypothetical protein